MSSNTPALAQTPPPPYYAVIFSSQRTETDRGYAHTAERMLELAKGRPGFLGIESVRGADGYGVTVSYWKDEESISSWKADSEHLHAQETGRTVWYLNYMVRVARVERAYGNFGPGPAHH
jgi:heme-degrading monooxygenase HmoA